MSKNSFGSQSKLSVGNKSVTIFRLEELAKTHPSVHTLPFSLKVLLENLLRNEDGVSVRREEIEALATWDAKAEPSREIQFAPGRVLLQDFTGVPAVVDLAAMRDAMKALGGDAQKINPLVPVELVIDHSVMIDNFGTATALEENNTLEFERNQERYRFLKWGQGAFANFKAVPPGAGICHQVNLEFLGRVVMENEKGEAYLDTVVGTDSHTTMINGLGVLGWGVGGIEAEAAMLGQPVSMLIPQVIGFRLKGKLPEGATATDLVLTVTQMLRKRGVVGKFVEYFGPGLADLSLADRATIANMAPEYGATCGIFPIDAETIRYLRFTGRSDEQCALVEAYARAQGVFHTAETKDAQYTDVLELDLSTVEPCLAGPARPQDRVKLASVKDSFAGAFAEYDAKRKGDAAKSDAAKKKSLVIDQGNMGVTAEAVKPMDNGAVVIAAITSCTNTSNPSVLVAAGLVAKKAVAAGLSTKPWVKTSLAPGSQVVTEYLRAAGLLMHLEALKFNVAGYGCTTCIGNSGPLPGPVSKEIDDRDLMVSAVLSGNRNFEGRVHAEVRANYLASPPLVVAYALAGSVSVDLTKDALGTGKDGKPVFLKDIWPSQKEVQDAINSALDSGMFRKVYSDAFKGDKNWNDIAVTKGEQYGWEANSTYVKHPPYFEKMAKDPAPLKPIAGARVLAVLGDSITTDHISPAGSIKKDGPAGKYLLENGVQVKDFNSYGSRRGNHEVMVRGTFANIRLRNQLAPGTEGGVTRHMPSGEGMSIFDAAMRYEQEGVPAIILAGKEYGSGSSRDWAAKGPKLLGIRAVIAESFERIHRSNLVGMGILPLEYKAGESTASLGLTGEESFEIVGAVEAVNSNFAEGKLLTVRATNSTGAVKEFKVTCRIDTPGEVHYYRHGGILLYVLRQLTKN
jgi:aconitate hydratase